MGSFDVIVNSVIEGNDSTVEREVISSLDEGAAPIDILKEALIGGMKIVGVRFKGGDMFLPEVLASAKAMHKGLDILKPLLAGTDSQSPVKVVIGTVEGDIHDLGKRIVRFMLEGIGCEVVDIGVNIKAEAFAQAVNEHKPDVLGLSALLTTTMPQMATVINLLKQKGLRNKTKIIVGGAPVNEEFATSIGADGYADEAVSATDLVKKLCGLQE